MPTTPAQPDTPHTNCLCQPRPWRRPEESAQATVDTWSTLVVSACGENLTFSPPNGAATVAARSWEGSHANPQPPPPATGQSHRSRANGRIGVGMGDGRPGRPLPCVGVKKKKGGVGAIFHTSVLERRTGANTHVLAEKEPPRAPPPAMGYHKAPSFTLGGAIHKSALGGAGRRDGRHATPGPRKCAR